MLMFGLYSALTQTSQFLFASVCLHFCYVRSFATTVENLSRVESESEPKGSLKNEIKDKISISYRLLYERFGSSPIQM